jgi:cytochrome c-type biogenesis protein CcmH
VTRRRWGWLALAVVLVGALLVGTLDERGSDEPEDRAHRVAESLMCPTCRGQSVADSDSSAARGIRNRIDDMVAEGYSADEIRSAMAARYGDDILLNPGRSGLAGLVWVLPVAALVGAAAGVALAFRRWRSRGAAEPSPADRDLVASYTHREIAPRSDE